MESTLKSKDDDFATFVLMNYGININKVSIKFIPDADLKKFEEEWKAWKEKKNGQTP